MRPLSLGVAGRVRRLPRRLLAGVVVGLAAAGVAAGVALARTGTTSIGTGVVVINTKVGYESASAAGTGMVLTSSGEVLTNNHVIRGATSIKIVVPGTKHSYTAKVVGYDVADDVAVLQAAAASKLKTVKTAASSKLRLGQKVTAIGNAKGTGRLVSATGSITGLQKSIVVSDDGGGTESLSGLIETNAGLQPGDSGGPLVNSADKVIGMDTAASSESLFSSAATDAYAIPIAKALSVAKQIESGHATTRVHVGSTAFLGIELQSASASGGFFSPGVVVAGVVPGGPAASAGLSAGDVITAIDGHAITSPSSVASLVLMKKPGAKVAITYLDQFGTTHAASVTLASGPPQ